MNARQRRKVKRAERHRAERFDIGAVKTLYTRWEVIHFCGFDPGPEYEEPSNPVHYFVTQVDMRKKVITLGSKNPTS
jgi:hypothetical protein